MDALANISIQSPITSTELGKGLSSEIYQEVNEIYHILAAANIPVRAYTNKALQGLLQSDDAKKQRILQDLKNWKNILMTCGMSLENVDERQLASKALGYFGFKIKNLDWIETIAYDEIIEIYSPQGIQLYRSLNFFNTCGYSLLDLYVHEWFVLWERPASIINRIHATVGEVLAGKKTDTQVPIGPHLIRETFDDGTTQPFLPRTAIVDFGTIYPTYGNSRSDIIGFVITSKGRIVSIGDEALEVDFI
jgi:hypothetical protein